MQNLTIALLATVILTSGSPLQAQSLKGSRASMERQNQEAIKYGYEFIQTSLAVTGFVDTGNLVKVEANRHFNLHDVSYPYARPAVKLFVERLSTQYDTACGEKMTVTSLTRPIDRQPANAAGDSVHPTGMAVDLRIPSKSSCRSWLEKTLLALEAADVLDVTRERNPPHYHVAVFTETYKDYVASMSETTQEYSVRSGDTLSRIASKTGTSIAQLRAINGLGSDMIRVGQKLQVSAGASDAVATTATAPARANEVAAITEVTHRVQRGETLWRIAKRYGTNVNLLRTQNDLADDFLDVGQVLHVGMNLRQP